MAQNEKEWFKQCVLTVFKPFCSAPAASQHVPAQPWPAKKQNQALTLNKEGFRFECFPYVCPEPVSVKIHREFKLEAKIVRFVSLSLPAALISTRAAARHCHRPPVDSRLPRLRLQPPPPRPPPAARIPPKLSPALFVCVPVKNRGLGCLSFRYVCPEPVLVN